MGPVVATPPRGVPPHVPQHVEHFDLPQGGHGEQPISSARAGEDGGGHLIAVLKSYFSGPRGRAKKSISLFFIFT